jgi:hypothetical protein
MHIHLTSPLTRGAAPSPLPSLNRTKRRISAPGALIYPFLVFAALAVFAAVLPAGSGAAQAGQAQKTGEDFLRFDEMYASVSSLGLTLSEKLLSLDGESVVMEGFMAPPLKPTLKFFVLTSVPMSICPFCSTDANWPSNIVLVFLKEEATALPFDRPIRVGGVLELGTETDEETGFVSLVRIYATSVEALK